jgi:MFS family permease
MDNPSRSYKPSDESEILDSSYAWWRLVASLVIGTAGGVGMWSSVVLIPEIQVHFEVDRSNASLPYTVAMIGIMFGNVFMGRMVDKFGVVVPTLVSAVSLGLGFAGVALSSNFWEFLFCQGLLIGALGTSGTFGPMIASVSLWFSRRRGIAMSLVASGSYVAGTIWPPFVHHLSDSIGWRDTHLVIGLICFVIMVPMALVLRGKPPKQEVVVIKEGNVTSKMLPMSPRLLQALLVVAGITCCVAMSMPQVHIVAHCVDLDIGAKRGAEMLSIMFGLGVVSRVIFGFLTDWIGAAWALFIGSSLQALSLLLYLPADGVMSLYIVSAMFGLFQGGIVPAYAVLTRDYFPASQAGVRVGIVLSATIGGMAFGGWLSGEIYDWTLSYQAAFINGFAWNLLNLLIVSFLLWKMKNKIEPLAKKSFVTEPIVSR